MTLEYDPDTAIAKLCKADKRLARLIKRVGPFNLEPKTVNPFQTLLRSIIYQQLSGKAAATIHARVLACFSEMHPLTPASLFAMSDEALRNAGMSRAKIAAAKDLAAKTRQGVVPPLAHLTTMADEEIIERLVTVRGIGRWTVEMLLIFRLGRPDILPVHDLGVRKGYRLTYGGETLPKPAELQAYGERWRPYRSVASWYMWRAVELPN